jgi:hypothetical protein
MMDWSQWIQDSVTELLGALARIGDALEQLAEVAEKEADGDG